MADSFTIDTAPITALAGGLGEAADRLTDPADLLADAAREVAKLAAPRTPRRTGRLAASVAVRRDATAGAPAAAIRWGVGYAVFVNFGTRRQRAQPFATGALAAAEPVVARLAESWATDTVNAI